MSSVKNVDLVGFSKVPFVELPFTDFAGDVNLRWKRMNGVLQTILDNYKNPRILDIATGGGHDTIYLLQEGYNVTANEVDGRFSSRLHAKANEAGLSPKVLGIDWRDFLVSPELQNEEYDVLFALGNSFPNYLFSTKERIIALRGFWRVLKPGGTLFFDTRNYDYMLANTEHTLEDPENNFDYRYGNTYLYQEIHGFPVVITPALVRMLYKHYGTMNWADLELCPVTQAEVTDLISSVLGNVEFETYFDYLTVKPAHYDFLQYVIHKPDSVQT